jgi:hypothetical protein
MNEERTSEYTRMSLREYSQEKFSFMKAYRGVDL